MTSTLPERHAFTSNRSSVQNGPDRAHSTLDSVPSSRVDASKIPTRLSLNELFELWTINRHVPKLGAREDLPHSQVSKTWIPLIRSPAIQHRGWLFKELQSIRDTDLEGVTRSVSFDFSSASRLPAVTKARHNPQIPQNVLMVNVGKDTPQECRVRDIAHHTRYSSPFLKIADNTAQVHEWSAVRTETEGLTGLGVVCSAHDSPKVQLKSEECTNTFIFSEDLARIFPFDSLALLERDSEGCIATTKTKPLRRCSNAMPDKFFMSAAVFARTMGEISQEPCMTSQLDMLDSLSDKILCKKGQHKQRAGRNLQGLRAQISTRYDRNGTGKAFSGLCPVSLKALAFWLKALSSYTTTCEQQGVTLVPQPLSTSEKRLANQNSREESSSVVIIESCGTSSVSSKQWSSAVVKVSATSRTKTRGIVSHQPLYCGSQNFQQWRPNPRLTVPQLIRQILEKPIGERSQKSGYVYIYWNPGNFGYVKIGFTASTVEKRLSQWAQGKCNHGVEEYTGSIGRQHVPHVYRVECLVLAELRNFRLKEFHCPCGRKAHDEWCNIGPQHVAKVRQKWEDFMLEQERYEPRVDGKFFRHTVTDEAFDGLCRPLPIETPMSPNTQKGSMKLRRSLRLQEKARGRT